MARVKSSRVGMLNPNWKGGRWKNKAGYVRLHIPEHPNADTQGGVAEHTIVMENIIGRHLLPEERIHHKDLNPSNNTPDNLQLFSSDSEHAKFHADLRAEAECGDKNKRRCRVCHEYDYIENMMRIQKNKPEVVHAHRECFKMYKKEKKKIRLEKANTEKANILSSYLKSIGGDDTWRKCNICKRYDAPENLYIKAKKHCYHRECHTEYNKSLKDRCII